MGEAKRRKLAGDPMFDPAWLRSQCDQAIASGIQRPRDFIEARRRTRAVSVDGETMGLAAAALGAMLARRLR